MRTLIISCMLGCLLPDMAAAQQYIYAATGNLLLRDRPDPVYHVMAIMQKNCSMRVEAYGKRTPAMVRARFCHVSLTRRDAESGRSDFLEGWVEKRYTTYARPAPGPQPEFVVVPMIPYSGDDRHNPNKMNYAAYPYPTFKGGEKTFPKKGPAARVYRRGPRGGCYYINSKGHKEYVDSRHCK